jgi:hypothetical protein
MVPGRDRCSYEVLENEMQRVVREAANAASAQALDDYNNVVAIHTM